LTIPYLYSYPGITMTTSNATDINNLHTFNISNFLAFEFVSRLLFKSFHSPWMISQMIPNNIFQFHFIKIKSLCIFPFVQYFNDLYDVCGLLLSLLYALRMRIGVTMILQKLYNSLTILMVYHKHDSRLELIFTFFSVASKKRSGWGVSTSYVHGHSWIITV
jgi:hypothetical protein